MADLKALLILVAVFSQVVEGVFIDFLSADVVDDVAGFDAFVIFAEPSVDPE